MSLVLVLTAVAVCIVVIESKERVASLVVLPPLVLGYDELYNDSSEDNETAVTQANQKTPNRKNSQRTIIDVKGRRLNDRKTYRSILKQLRALRAKNELNRYPSDKIIPSQSLRAMQST